MTNSASASEKFQFEAKLRHILDEDDKGLKAFYENLQGNILKGHGRHHTVNRFFSFDPARADEIKAAIAGLASAGQITSAAAQQSATESFRSGGPADVPAVFLFLSRFGYEKLGVSADLPAGDAFTSGMKARTEKLSDPSVADWDPLFRNDIDCLLLVGMPGASEAAKLADTLTAVLSAAGATKLGDESGLAIFNAAGEGLEHFGYVDGRSQPLFLKGDIGREIVVDGTDKWNPRFAALDTVLVRDPKGGESAFGSFFVFRKLEQNVKGFKEAEEALADKLKLGDGEPDPVKKKSKRELAGAMVVGRFEDGTPLMIATSAEGQAVANNFNYEADPDGLVCPFQAHIRKTNPRGDVRRRLAPGSDRGDRGPIMARRGITYGQGRQQDKQTLELTDRPEKDFGLLFMAYQKDLEDQFEFTQESWANEEKFVRGFLPGESRTGIDPVIGHGLDRNFVWPLPQGGTEEAPFAQMVTMKGGEYFFAPSIGYLKQLATSSTPVEMAVS
jgi:Dyp-type peroxidase family